MTTLAQDMTASQPYVPQLLPAGFYQIDSEYLRVLSDTQSEPSTRGGGQLDVVGSAALRGIAGSVAAAHAAGATITAYQPAAPGGGGGGGGVTVTDGTTTVDPTTSILVSAVSEDTPGEGTIIAMPPGVAYDADNLLLRIHGTETIAIVFDDAQDPDTEYLRLTASGLVLNKDNGQLELNAESILESAFVVNTFDGTNIYVGGVSNKTFALSTVAGAVVVSVTTAGAIKMPSLPTADPLVAGQLYSDGVPSAGVPKTLKISGG